MKKVILSLVVISLSALTLPLIAHGNDLRMANDRSNVNLRDVAEMGEVRRYDELQRFAGIAGMLNEVEERRRRVVYQQYPGSATQGVVHAFVHVTDGSAAFAKMDMVVRSAMPIVVRRVYQSRRHSSRNLSLVLETAAVTGRRRLLGLEPRRLRRICVDIREPAQGIRHIPVIRREPR